MAEADRQEDIEILFNPLLRIAQNGINTRSKNGIKMFNE